MLRGVLAVGRAAVVVVTILIPVSGHGLDIRESFSLPDAPDAGTLASLAVDDDVILAPLTDGTVKFFLPDGGAGNWGSLPASVLMEGAEEPVNVPALGKRCADLFGKDPGGSGNAAQTLCVLLWAYRNGLHGTAPDPSLLPTGLLPPDADMRGMSATTGPDGEPVLFVATDREVHALTFTQEGIRRVSQTLNRIPVFTGAPSASCRSGEGVVELPVEARDPDGDRVTITQTNSQAGFSGETIRHDCAVPGIYTWSLQVNDGKLDPRDVPVRDYAVTVVESLNAPPVWEGFVVRGAMDVPGEFPVATDPDGDQLSYGGVLPHVTINPDGSYAPEPGWCGTTEGEVSVTDGRRTMTVPAAMEIPCRNEPATGFLLTVAPVEVRAGTGRIETSIVDVKDVDGGFISTVVIRKGNEMIADGPDTAFCTGPFRKGEVFTIEATVDGLVKRDRRTVLNSPPYPPRIEGWQTIAGEQNYIELRTDQGVRNRDPDPADDGGPCPAGDDCVTYLWGGEIPTGLLPDPEDSSVLRGTVAPEFIQGSGPAVEVEIRFWVQKRDAEGALSEKAYHTMTIMNTHAPF